MPTRDDAWKLFGVHAIGEFAEAHAGGGGVRANARRWAMGALTSSARQGAAELALVAVGGAVGGRLSRPCGTRGVFSCVPRSSCFVAARAWL